MHEFYLESRWSALDGHLTFTSVWIKGVWCLWWRVIFTFSGFQLAVHVCVCWRQLSPARGKRRERQTDRQTDRGGRCVGGRGEVSEVGDGRMHKFNSLGSLKARPALYVPSNHLKQENSSMSEQINWYQSHSLTSLVALDKVLTLSRLHCTWFKKRQVVG